MNGPNFIETQCVWFFAKNQNGSKFHFLPIEKMMKKAKENRTLMLFWLTGLGISDFSIGSCKNGLQMGTSKSKV